jgi:hypothetical protein
MMNFDEQPLDRDSAPLDQSTRPRRSRRPLIIVAVVGLLAGAAAAWWWTRGSGSPDATATAASPGGAAPAPAAEPAPVLPPLGQMDTFLRALLGTLSSHPDLARWLATDDLIRQMANGIDLVSRGFSPARQVSVLRPQGDFAVTGRRTAMTIDPQSFHRYDRLAALVESLDPAAVAKVYRTIQPRLDEAYRALGRTEGDVDAAVHVALQTLIDTPVTATNVAVVPGKGATYAYADPAFEGLLPVQKQLARMGPDNMQRIQTRLRDIKAALTSSESRVR